jgi:hypothetical protein
MNLRISEFIRHSRESGNPGHPRTESVTLGPRFCEGDGNPLQTRAQFSVGH